MYEVTLRSAVLASGVFVQTASTLVIYSKLERVRVIYEGHGLTVPWTREEAVQLCDLIDSGSMITAQELAEIMGFECGIRLV